MPLADILDIVLRARPQAISLEAANPRHAHEWLHTVDPAITWAKLNSLAEGAALATVALWSS